MAAAVVPDLSTPTDRAENDIGNDEHCHTAANLNQHAGTSPSSSSSLASASSEYDDASCPGASVQANPPELLQNLDEKLALRDPRLGCIINHPTDNLKLPPSSSSSPPSPGPHDHAKATSGFSISPSPLMAGMETCTTWDQGLFHFIFFILGLALLLPWNVILSSNDFFGKAALRGTGFENSFEAYTSCTFTTANLAAVVYVSIFPFRNRRFAKTFHVASLVAMTILLILFAVACIKYRELDTNTFFILLMILCLAGGPLTSFVLTDCFSLASFFPFTVTQQVLVGQAVAGFVISTIQAGLSIFGNSRSKSVDASQTSSVASFIVSGLVVGLAAVGYWAMDRTKYWRAAKGQTLSVDGENVLPHGATRGVGETPSESEVNHGLSHATLANDRNPLPDAPLVTVQERFPDSPGTPGETDAADDRHLTVLTARSIRHNLVAVFLDFFVTLSLLSGYLNRVQASPSAPEFLQDFFFSIAIVCFNLGDLVGRWILPSRCLGFFVRRPWTLILYALVRWVLHYVHFLGFSNLPINGHMPFATDLGDIVFLLMTLLLGLGNGSLSAFSMTSYTAILGQSTDPRVQRKMAAILPTAGKLMTLALVAGLACGSWFGFALKFFLCRCNPFVA